VTIEDHKCRKKPQSGESWNLRSEMSGRRRGYGRLLRSDFASSDVSECGHALSPLPAP
jgi:hypothetical protein